MQKLFFTIRSVGLMAILSMLCMLQLAHATEASPLAQDPVVEKRLIAISTELRCLVCQNESLAASQAELAIDLRNQVRELIIDNKTDQEILDYLKLNNNDGTKGLLFLMPV